MTQVDGMGRATSLGSMWLNRVFVPPASRPRRLWARSSVRVSIVQMVFFGIFFILYALLLLGLGSLLTNIPGLNNLVGPWLLALIVSPPLAWVTARRVSRAAPYRRVSGEGMEAWFWVKADQVGPVMGTLVGRTIATNTYESWATGKRTEVECVEWLGTARLPRAAKRGIDVTEPSVVDTRPRTVPDEWIRKSQQRNALRAALIREAEGRR